MDWLIPTARVIDPFQFEEQRVSRHIPIVRVARARGQATLIPRPFVDFP